MLLHNLLNLLRKVTVWNNRLAIFQKKDLCKMHSSDFRAMKYERRFNNPQCIAAAASTVLKITENCFYFGVLIE